MNWFRTLLIAQVITFGFVGCGGGSGPEEPENPEPTAELTEEETTTEESLNPSP